MRVKKFLESSSPYKLKYMAFDWDDNILFMGTKIHLEHKVGDKWVDESVSTDKFAEVRNSPDWRVKDNPVESFGEFRDYGPRGPKAFLEDTKEAIQNKKFGPSWDQFIKCLIRGNIFAIITARGHEPHTLRSGVEYIINTYLTQEEKNEMAANLVAFHSLFNPDLDLLQEWSFDKLVKEYLDCCDFIGITSKYFESLAKDKKFTSENPEEAKIEAMKIFLDKIKSYGEHLDREVMVGFSDDDKGNVENVHKFFKNELNYLIDYTIFDTSDPHLKGGKIISEVKTFEQFTFNFDWIDPTEK